MRNDQITGEWHLLRLLEGSQGRSLQELVAAVPEDYLKNTRTVRRDLEALKALGFPIMCSRHARGWGQEPASRIAIRFC